LRLVPFIVVGCLLVFSYNLELFGGVMHSDVWFGLAWGSFPALVGAYAQHWTLSLAAVIAAAAAFFLSMGQRALSTPARTLRRRGTASPCSCLRASGAAKRSACWRASGATHREGGRGD